MKASTNSQMGMRTYPHSPAEKDIPHPTGPHGGCAQEWTEQAGRQAL